VVSIGLGVIALGEHVAWNAPVGAAIIIAGAMLSRAARRPTAAPGGTDACQSPSAPGGTDACPSPSAPNRRWVRGLG